MKNISTKLANFALSVFFCMVGAVALWLIFTGGATHIVPLNQPPQLYGEVADKATELANIDCHFFTEIQAVYQTGEDTVEVACLPRHLMVDLNVGRPRIYAGVDFHTGEAEVYCRGNDGSQPQYFMPNTYGSTEFVRVVTHPDHLPGSPTFSGQYAYGCAGRGGPLSASN